MSATVWLQGYFLLFKAHLRGFWTGIELQVFHYPHHDKSLMMYWSISSHLPITFIDSEVPPPTLFSFPFCLSLCVPFTFSFLFSSRTIHLPSLPGSVSLQCDAEGRCACRVGVTGERCDTCRAGFHSLGPGGCRWATSIAINTDSQTRKTKMKQEN